MFDFSGTNAQNSAGDELDRRNSSRGGSMLMPFTKRPLRLSRIFVIKSLGPQLIPFTQSTCIYFVLFLPHDAVSLTACFIKCLPIISLSLFVLLHGNILSKTPTPNQTYSRWIFAGLILSGLGDAFLQFSALGYFLPGMAAFGAAHLCYAAAFGLDPVHPLSGAIIFTLASGIFVCLMPYLPGIFLYAVGVYFVLVCTMGWRAIARVPLLNDLWTWTKLACAIGALLFCLSDLMIAIKIFYMDFPMSQVLIMTTYYVGQMGIAVSVVEGQLRPSQTVSLRSRATSPALVPSPTVEPCAASVEG